MAMSVVRCPFCDRRYNVTGIPSGTKVLCTSCRATLTVPARHSAARPALWRRLVPESSSAQIAVGLVAGLFVATVGYVALRSRVTAVPDVASPVAENAVEPAGPARAADQERTLGMFKGLPRDQQIQKFTDGVYHEFERARFEIDQRSSSPFVLACETDKLGRPHQLFDVYQHGLESLIKRFSREFGAPLGLGEPDEILPIIIFTSKETFDDYQRRGNNPPLPPQVPGIYEYAKKRVVFYHGRMKGTKSFPVEVILHEAVHQIVHYHFRMRSDQHDRPLSLWFQEGLATYFEQYKHDDLGRAVVEPSLPSPRLAALKESIKRQDLPPLRELMAMDIDQIWAHWNAPASSAEEQDRKMRYAELCYGEAWALVHFLRHGAGGKYRRLFDEYFKRELEGQGGKETFVGLLSDRFGMELAKLGLELEDYLKAQP